MESALRSLDYRNLLVYVDDVIAFSKDFDQHLKHLADIFDHLRAANLKLKPPKCHFAVNQVEFLGHVISKDGISTDPEKVRAVVDFPTPQSQKDVRVFLGLATHYRKFIRNFATIASSLNKLVSTDVPFQWSEDCQQAFDTLKQALTSAPILVYPNFDKPTILMLLMSQ
jgi:hypothetical protein